MERSQVEPSSKDEPVRLALNGVLPSVKTKRAGPNAGAVKGRRNWGKLQKMLNMPLDIFYEVWTHLAYPTQSRTNLNLLWR